MKRLLASILTLVMLVSLVPLSAAAAEVSIWDRVPKTPTTQTNTGDMNRIPFNNPDLVVDISVGFRAHPAVMDYDGDGHFDLVLSATGDNYRHTFVYYGDKDSKDTLLMSRGDILGGTPLHWSPTYLYDKREVTDGEGNASYEYDYLETDIFNGSIRYFDFINDFIYGESEDYDGGAIAWPRDYGDQNCYGLADIDGDGNLDLIHGDGDLSAFDMQNDRFDENGAWDFEENGIYGWVMWAKNNGTNENPDFAAEGQHLLINNNPETPVYSFSEPSPNLYDFDKDGDLDLMCGSYSNDIIYFKNIGTATEPSFAEAVAPKHRDGSNIQADGFVRAVTCFDWNGDGYLDILVGEEFGRIRYYQNTGLFGENGEPIVEDARYFQAPAENLHSGYGCMTTPFSLDWDNDGDEDLFAGGQEGYLTYIKNLSVEEGRPLTDPSWDAPVALTEPDGTVINIRAGANGSPQGPIEEVLGYLVPTMGDWDGDGDADMIFNTTQGKIMLLENLNNNGANNTALNFAAPVQVRVEDPSPKKLEGYWWQPEPYKLQTAWRVTPLMYDLDEDGDMDIVMMDGEGYLCFYERYTDSEGVLRLYPGERIFLNSSGGSLRINPNSAGRGGRHKYRLTDWDGDGKLDIIRYYSDSVGWMKNIGTDSQPYKFADVVALHTGVNIAGHGPTPSLCDWNKDGIPDLIIGSESGDFYYYENETPQYVKTEVNPEDVVKPTAYLTARWDFEQTADDTDGTTVLKDKAQGVTGAAGTVADDLTIANTVTVSDGYATLTGTGALVAADSVDLSPTSELTIFFKAKVTGKASRDVGLVDKRASGDIAYAVALPPFASNVNFIVSQNGTQNKSISVEENNLPMDEWREYAYVIANTGTNLEQRVYVSKGESTIRGSDYRLVSTQTVAYTAIKDSAASFVIGNQSSGAASNTYQNEGRTRYFDEVQLYNKALTVDELATILSPDDLATVISIPTAPELKALAINNANLFPIFEPGIRRYQTRVANSMSTAIVSADAKDGGSVAITVNGVAATVTDNSATANLSVGDNIIKVTCIHPQNSNSYSEYTITITREEAGTDVTANLIAKWDFEGTTEEEKLADKGSNTDLSPLGKSDGTHETNNVILKNGRAVYPDGLVSYLATAGNAELDTGSQVSMVARVRLESIVAELPIIDHRNTSNQLPYAMFIGKNGTTRGHYGIGGQIKAGNKVNAVNNNPYSPAALGEWATLAMVVKPVDNKGVMYLYVSTCENPTSGDDFVLVAPPTTISDTNLTANTSPVYVGNTGMSATLKTMIGDMEIEEARIYNTALTIDQLVTVTGETLLKDANALSELMTEADTLEKETYLEETWLPFEAALEDAKQVAGTSATTSQISDSYWALDKAMYGLVASTYTGSSLHSLEELIALRNSAPTDLNQYTSSSVNALELALSNADVIIKDNISPLPSPYDIDDAYLALDAAIKGLAGDILVLSKDSVKIHNLDGTAKLILSSYTGDVLLDMKMIDVSGSYEKLLTEVELNFANADRISAFLWKDLTTLTPMAQTDTIDLTK